MDSMLFTIPLVQRFLGFHEQCYTLSGSDLPYHFVGFPSSFYESYHMDGTSTSTSLMNQLVQAVIPPQHVLTLSSYTMKRNDDSKYIRIKPLNVTQII